MARRITSKVTHSEIEHETFIRRHLECGHSQLTDWLSPDRASRILTSKHSQVGTRVYCNECSDKANERT